MLKGFISAIIIILTVFIAQPAAASQAGGKIGEADPVHTVNHDFGRHAITYSDGTTAIYSADYKPLIINGSLIKADVKTVNDRTLVPIRAIVENLGGKISWDEKTQKVTIEKDKIKIEMTIGSTSVKINDQIKQTDVPPNIYNNYTYLPVRFVSENFGADVVYNELGKASVIVKGVPGNVIINQFDPKLPVISKADAVSEIKDISAQQYKKMKAARESNPIEPADRVFLETGYRIIEQNIENTNVTDDFSRYYMVDGVVHSFLYDKYTGSLYLQGGDGSSDWVEKYDPDDYNMFFRGYFAG